MKVIPAIVILTMVLSGCGLRAGTQCTDAPQSEWMDQDVFQQQLTQQGYQIDRFLVTDGSCYEIYGKNNAGQNVEIYFNPVTGESVKEEID